MASWFRKVSILTIFLMSAPFLPAQATRNRYALILDDSPVASQFSKESMAQAGAANYRRSLQQRQQAVRTELARRGIVPTGSTTALVNAIFVMAPADSVADLQNIPGVKSVVPLRTYHRKLNRATTLVNAPAAWSAVGGVNNAGAGVKIAILDTGIDQQHPAFQDPSLPMPAGYPRCNGSDCAFTNNKVIVARSYVQQLAAGSSSQNPAADSRPDDYSPRDRVGHGTAVASAAAGHTNAGLVAISGVAPAAYLGNYKIYGSPEVNDFTTDDVIIQALEDAMNDGMDIVSFSSGGPAFTGALDTGAACGAPAGQPCDLVALAFENAVKAGMVVVAAAGNEGSDGDNYPTFNSISSPGDAPSVIAVGATTNSHTFAETVDVPGRQDLHNLNTNPGDSLIPPGVVRGPLLDVSVFGSGPLGCSAFPAYSLDGMIALIKRGTCNFSDKAQNAWDAGAVGVILYMADASPPLSFTGASSVGIPVAMISLADGQSLADYAASVWPPLVDINSHGREVEDTPNLVVGFSSIGPSADASLKPDVMAVGGNWNHNGSIYMAAQKYDPLGDLYSADGYANADGTSFSTPLVAGAAALVKQKHPGFSAAQVKSAVVNMASSTAVTHDDSGDSVDVRWVGGGLLAADAAVAATVTSDPATLSFGSIRPGATLPLTRTFTIRNSGTTSVSLTLGVTTAVASAGASVTIAPPSVTLGPGNSVVAVATVSGSVPAAGAYSGVITVQGGPNSLRIPYLFFGPSGAAANLITLEGDFFDGVVGGGSSESLLAFKLVDSYGLPVSGVPVTWTPSAGASLKNASSATDAFGVASADPILGPNPGVYSYKVTAGGPGGMSHTFTGIARPQPIISSVVDGASLVPGTFAPGSYISIVGSGLSDVTDAHLAAPHPLAIDSVSVGFDVPSAHLSVPGHLIYASSTWINVQVPWELKGQTTAQVKVNVNFSPSNVFTITLAPVAPSFFLMADGNVWARDLNYRAVNAGSPAHPGETIELYANGLGPVTNQPASGDPAPAGPYAETPTPVVMIGAQTANVLFSGLTPGSGTLYVMNVVVPPSLAPGTYPVTVSIGGRTSPAASIVVD
jgi:minor extracellular serine protease Vpr